MRMKPYPKLYRKRERKREGGRGEQDNECGNQ